VAGVGVGVGSGAGDGGVGSGLVEVVGGGDDAGESELQWPGGLVGQPDLRVGIAVLQQGDQLCDGQVVIHWMPASGSGWQVGQRQPAVAPVGPWSKTARVWSSVQAGRQVRQMVCRWSHQSGGRAIGIGV
jgi:hypothetical protein